MSLQTTNSNLMKMAESSPNGYKLLWEREKLLNTSNFSFFYSVFKNLERQTHKNQGLSGKGLKEWGVFYPFRELSAIFIKLKFSSVKVKYQGHIFKMYFKWWLISLIGKKTLRQKERGMLSAFSRFPTTFSKGFFHGLSDKFIVKRCRVFPASDTFIVCKCFEFRKSRILLFIVWERVIKASNKFKNIPFYMHQNALSWQICLTHYQIFRPTQI